MSYLDSLAAEQKAYENCVDVHALPPIFHYWSHQYLLPKLQSFGFSGTRDMFAKVLLQACAADRRPHRFLSLGAGNCDLEIDLARSLQAQARDFILDCVDLNPSMLERGRIAAQQAGVASQFNFIAADLNYFDLTRDYDAVIASQSLHHVVNLEDLFEKVQKSLRPGGKFLIADMIGRNGHQRWPEALPIVQEFWRKLPPSYRFNRLLGSYDEFYQDWDCSSEAFEGVRSQDILPLLLKQFHFHFFLSYGNLIDPFIDRAFGYHFDPASPWDRAFIDEVHRRDEDELASGRLKPTHMIAVVSNQELPGYPSPESYVRNPEKIVPASNPAPPYDWSSWPHDNQKELEIVCRRLAGTGHEIRQRTSWALSIQKELDERTAWSLSLQKDLESHTAWGRRLERDFEDRTTWARSLEAEVERIKAQAQALRQYILELEHELEDRTAWALRLDNELAVQTAKAEHLERKLDRPILRLLAKFR